MAEGPRDGQASEPVHYRSSLALTVVLPDDALPWMMRMSPRDEEDDVDKAREGGANNSGNE